jgi:hypothetical protein
MILNIEDNIVIEDNILLWGPLIPPGPISIINVPEHMLYIQQGSPYLKKINFAVLYNLELSDYTYELEIKEYTGTKKLPIVFSVLYLDYIRISANIAETAKMNKSRYVYRLKATNQNETVTLMFGQILVTNF